MEKRVIINTNHDNISNFPQSLELPSIRDTTAAPVLMIVFHATPKLYYFHLTRTEGIYVFFLVLDEFRVPVPCRL